MANNHARTKPANTRSRLTARNSGNDSFRDSVFVPISETEEPLLEATHLVNTLSILDPKECDDLESIGFVATKAGIRLKELRKIIRKLFVVCR